MYKGKTSDFNTPLKLNYDLTKLYNATGGQFMTDLLELQNKHGMVYPGKLSITGYEDILKCANDYNSSQASARPSVVVVQTGKDCSGELQQTYLTAAQVRGNILPNIYMLGTQTATFTVTIKTIETGRNHVRVTWQATSTNPYGQRFLQNAEGKISADGVMSTNVGTKEIACRIEDDTKAAARKVRVVSNTVGREIEAKITETEKTIAVKPVNRAVAVAPELRQPVYYNGEFNDAIVWDSPNMVMEILD